MVRVIIYIHIFLFLNVNRILIIISSYRKVNTIICYWYLTFCTEILLWESCLDLEMNKYKYIWLPKHNVLWSATFNYLCILQECYEWHISSTVILRYKVCFGNIHFTQYCNGFNLVLVLMYLFNCQKHFSKIIDHDH